MSISFSADRQYNFGTTVKQVDFFAFPRAGSHFLQYCLSGLFDLVSRLPAAILTNAEAASRQNELNELAIYALKLRESGVPYQPLWVNPMPNGVHGKPIAVENPALILIRHPLAALYSAWRARKRLGFQLESAADFARRLDEYQAFYDAGQSLAHAKPQSTLIVRFEDLVAEVATLERLVEFVGLRPKLSPHFVHWVTRFENMVAQGERSFYREGNNDAWKTDAEFAKLVAAAGPARDFERFGYSTQEASPRSQASRT